MAEQPIDYGIRAGQIAQAASAPLQGFAQGFNLGDAIYKRDLQMQLMNEQRQAYMELQRTKQAQAQASAERQQAFQGRMAKIMAQPRIERRDFGRVMAEFPEYVKQLKDIQETMSPDLKAAKIRRGREIMTAIEGGNIQLAKGLYTQERDAYKASGNEEFARRADDFIRLLGQGKPGASAVYGFTAANVYAADPEAFEKFGGLKVKERQAGVAEAAEQRLASEQAFGQRLAQARLQFDKAKTAEQFKLDWFKARQQQDKDKLEAQKLSPQMYTDVSKLVKESDDLLLRRGTTQNLLDSFEGAPDGSGVSQRVKDTWQKFWGSEDGRVLRKTLFSGVRNREIMKNLKGTGSVSNEEFFRMAEGVIPVDATNAQIRAFLQNAVDVLNLERQAKIGRRRWLIETRGFGAAPRQFRIGDTVIAKGATYDSFIEGRYKALERKQREEAHKRAALESKRKVTGRIRARQQGLEVD